jgi:hypothetical protein
MVPETFTATDFAKTHTHTHTRLGIFVRRHQNGDPAKHSYFIDTQIYVTNSHLINLFHRILK